MFGFRDAFLGGGEVPPAVSGLDPDVLDPSLGSGQPGPFARDQFQPSSEVNSGSFRVHSQDLDARPISCVCQIHTAGQGAAKLFKKKFKLKKKH